MRVNKRFLKWFSIVLILVIAVSATFGLGYSYGKKQVVAVSNVDGVDMTVFWKTWNELEAHFVPSGTSSKPITAMDKVYGATEGLADSYGDPYTVFMSPEENQSFSEDISGSFGGVGMEIGIEGGLLTVVAPIKGSPAERGGVKAGDKIIKIDSEVVGKPNLAQAIRRIRGVIGTEVEVTFLRSGEKSEIVRKFVRSRIEIPTISTEVLPGNIFVIHLYNFSASSHSLFRDALRKFVLARSDKLIIDLRNNPGGYLEAAVDMVSWFLPTGKVIVSEDYGGRQDGHVFRSKGYDIFNNNLKLVILVNNGSASASEIMAGALQDHGRAKVIGQKTYGKGSVQNLIDITEDTSLKVTVAHWLTPSGKSISHNGLDPDIVVEEPKEKPEKVSVAGSDKKPKDAVMERAVNYLLTGK